VEQWQDLTEKQARYRLDEAFYDRLRQERARREHLESVVVPPGDARALIIRAGHVFRVTEETGPQIGSVTFWNLRDHRETLKSARTMAHEGAYIRPYAQLLSGEPWVRPMITCVGESYAVAEEPPFQRNTIGTFCSHQAIQMWFGRKAKCSCCMNLLRVAEPFGIGKEHLFDSVNVHQKVDIRDPQNGRILLGASTAAAGDYVEFYAEMDLLLAISSCPLGDGTADPTTDLTGLKPLRIDLYDCGVPPKVFPPFMDWRLQWKGHWEWPKEG
jgi:uncharacterized protein YcgI (DUF1989 family)